jgi:hypothetical protein
LSEVGFAKTGTIDGGHGDFSLIIPSHELRTSTFKDDILYGKGHSGDGKVVCGDVAEERISLGHNKKNQERTDENFFLHDEYKL